MAVNIAKQLIYTRYLKQILNIVVRPDYSYPVHFSLYNYHLDNCYWKTTDQTLPVLVNFHSRQLSDESPLG